MFKLSLTKIFYVAFFLSFFFHGANVLVFFKYYDVLGKDMLSPTIILFTILAVILRMRGYKMKDYLFEIMLVSFLMLLALFPFQNALGVKAVYSTFFSPIIVCFCIDVLANRLEKKILKRIFYSFFILECALAIFERVTYRCVFPVLPFETGFNLQRFMFRSYSLYGHPLSNSAIILTMTCFILIYQKNETIKFLCFMLGVVGILCFNSRFALILDLCFGMLYFARSYLFSFSSIRYQVFFISFIALFVFLIQMTLNMGFGDRIFELGIYDEGSASARLDVFEIFRGASIFDFVLPLDTYYYSSLMSNTEVTIIENPWIILMFRYGLIWLLITIFMYVLVFMRRFKYVKKEYLFFLLLPWLLQVSSSNSIANPSFAISQLFLFQFIMGENYDFQNNSLLLAKQ